MKHCFSCYFDVLNENGQIVIACIQTLNRDNKNMGKNMKTIATLTDYFRKL